MDRLSRGHEAAGRCAVLLRPVRPRVPEAWSFSGQLSCHFHEGVHGDRGQFPWAQGGAWGATQRKPVPKGASSSRA